jgi:hypothetical protein
VAGSDIARADVEGTLVTCSDPSGGTLIGNVKFSPGLTTVQNKQTVTGTVELTGCSANEAALDEIAAFSKFGVTKTAAAGRPSPITRGIAKIKLTTYGDCLGIATPDPDSTGEYPLHGTAQISWLTASGTRAAKSTAFFRVDLSGAQANSTGFVTKGLGIGGGYSSSINFSPTDPEGDSNGNALDDFLDCVLFSDPTAVSKVLQVVTPSSTSISLPVTP